MRHSARLFGNVGMLAVGILLVTLLVVRPFWSLIQEWRRQEHKAELSQQELEYKKAAWTWRNQCKKQVLAEYFKGRLSVWETAAWFHHLNNQPADMPFARPQGWTGTRSQWDCQDVINWGYNARESSSDPAVVEAVERLESELKPFVDPPRQVKFPQPPSLPVLPPCPQREST